MHKIERLLFIMPITVLIFLIWAGAAQAAGEGQAGSDSRLSVYVSILPQAYFVEQVGGEQVDVSVLVGPGQSPATYEPTPRQMAGLSDADVYFRIGVLFEERLLEKITQMMSNLNVVDTRRGVPLREMEKGHDHQGYSHGEGAADPHIWLDPILVKTQAQTICDELKRLAPAHAGDFDTNLKAFQANLDSLDAKIRTVLAPYAGARFYVFHPSFGYFADRYGMGQVAVEIEGKEPGAQQLAAMIAQARADSISAIFVQAQFSRRPAQAIAHELDIELIDLDPLSRDYIHNLETMAEQLAHAFHHAADVNSAPTSKEGTDGQRR